MLPFSYELHEMAHFAWAPARAVSDVARTWLENPINPLSLTAAGRNLAASAKIFERLTRRYGKPAFDFATTVVDGKIVPIVEVVVWERPFCKLLHFETQFDTGVPELRQKLLIVAPMSSHHATLLRGTVEAFLPFYEVYITDWADARTLPLSAGRFDLDDYIDYLIAMCETLSKEHDGVSLHSLGVCQPSVPLIAAVALMEAQDSPHVPASMTLMGGPIDTRQSPTKVNLLAQERGSEWFRRNCICTVPYGYAGVGRDVYPGFLQLTGFLAMNIDRHVNAHFDFFDHLVTGDGDSAARHREFYNEYRSVMDLTAEFFLQTIDTVFVKHALPKGEMKHRAMCQRRSDFASASRSENASLLNERKRRREAVASRFIHEGLSLMAFALFRGGRVFWNGQGDSSRRSFLEYARGGSVGRAKRRSDARSRTRSSTRRMADCW